MTTAADIRVSVILCVKNGRSTILQQLDALARQQTVLAWEIVIVDNGSTDDTRQLVEAWIAEHPAIVATVVDGSQVRGLAAARNVGARAAAGDLLLFCDADDEADRHWIGELAATLGEVDVAGGYVDLERLNPPEVRSWQLLTRQAAVISELPQVGIPAQGAGIPFAVGANMGITASSFWRLGGCDTSLLGAWEEVDLCVRAHFAGCRIGFAPAAVMHYRLRDSLWGVVRQFRGYGRGEADFRLKHGGPPAIVAMTWRTELRSGLVILAGGLRSAVGGRSRRREWLQQAAYRWGLWTRLLVGRKRRRSRRGSLG